MDIWDKSKIIIFLLFVIPGFISMKVYSVLRPNAIFDTSKAIIEIVSYSCMNYAIWFFPIYCIESSEFYLTHPVLYFLIYLSILFISPILLTIFFSWMRTWNWLRTFMPHPTGKAWDYFFGLRVPCWVIVTLKDGKKIAGKYGANSFASSAPEPEQIYLEEHWVLSNDGGLERPRVSTLGILILSKDIEHLEFFRFESQTTTNP
ncbi:DUF6338 family protein [Klebsiella aerogenes]|uniref:DUF6338 family protein n=1 Tax=Klebsiella aerogenes TaxID=548 RepID=UPI000664E4C4|nr:DUF6338 family protein [Klebsiella aerogenes]KZQ21420.1 hypothetical protein A3N45_05010 [Klebsiella aerogenes]MEA8782900.1 DUF6338 family protein [Klebsiella aerogenes]OAZ24897.1 hypothetical protein A1Q75_12405 [Klebsiella aerogenes]OAZ25377.1 hypothetical protein AW170_14825 [Klebsiella aerogenes]OAZ28162.1 hypothetical protein A1J85_16035 [Klebsiella aerogenes]